MRVGGGGRCGEWRIRGGERGFSASSFLRAARARLRGEKTRRILYGLRSCLNSRSPDVDGKREPRDRPRCERKITAGAGFQITRVCRESIVTLESPTRSLVMQQLLHRHSLHKQMVISEVYGSVAQLVVRQIPALKAGGSNPSWVNVFLLIKYTYKTFVRMHGVLV